MGRWRVLRGRTSVRLLLSALAAIALLVAAGSAWSEIGGSSAPAPTIASDKADYNPGETVTLTGANWQPGEAVHIFVNDDQGQTWSHSADVTAAADGTLIDRFQLPDWI